MKKNILLFGLGFFLAILGAIQAESFDGIGIGPRALAMAGAFTAAADDISSVYYNPAGLASMKRMVWNMAYDNLYGMGLFNYFFLGYGKPNTGPGTLAMSWTFLSLGDNISIRNYNENTFLLSYGLNLAGRMKFGVSGKIYLANYSQSVGTGLTADAGFIYDVGRGFSAGISCRDITAPGIFWDTKWVDILPPRLNAGLSWRGGNVFLVDIDGHDLLNSERNLAVGGEIKFFNGILMVRSGASVGRLFSFSIGCGVVVSDCQFDYCLLHHEDLDWDNSFSASLRI